MQGSTVRAGVVWWLAGLNGEMLMGGGEGHLCRAAARALRRSGACATCTRPVLGSGLNRSLTRDVNAFKACPRRHARWLAAAAVAQEPAAARPDAIQPDRIQVRACAGGHVAPARISGGCCVVAADQGWRCAMGSLLLLSSLYPPPRASLPACLQHPTQRAHPWAGAEAGAHRLPPAP